MSDTTLPSATAPVASLPQGAFTVRGITERYGIPRSTIYELIRAGKLDARKLGRRTLITCESLAAFVSSLPRA